MRFLLDTHVYLWYIAGDPRLSITLQEKIQCFENEVFVSSVSIWEAVIKHQLGKLSLPANPDFFLADFREKHSFTSLPLDEKSVLRLFQLPVHHRDPFDRMLICQAIENDLIFITIDEVIAKYPVKILK